MEQGTINQHYLNLLQCLDPQVSARVTVEISTSADCGEESKGNPIYGCPFHPDNLAILTRLANVVTNSLEAQARAIPEPPPGEFFASIKRLRAAFNAGETEIATLAELMPPQPQPCPCPPELKITV